MTLLQSLLFFGLPGLAIFLGIYLAVLFATASGVPLIVAWTLALWGPIVVQLVWVLMRWRNSAPHERFRDRFRLHALPRRVWGVILLAFLAVQLGEAVLAQVTPLVAQWPFFAPPPVLPELFSPGFDPAEGLETFLGVPVRGNWWLVLFWLGWLVVNIGGEEILWRGYALPLQERVFGRYAWLVNGLCWNLLIHAFMRWTFLALMPVSLVIPYLVQRYRNTWIGIWIHGLGNLLVLVLLVPSIAGWI